MIELQVEPIILIDKQFNDIFFTSNYILDNITNSIIAEYNGLFYTEEDCIILTFNQFKQLYDCICYDIEDIEISNYNTDVYYKYGLIKLEYNYPNNSIFNGNTHSFIEETEDSSIKNFVIRNFTPNTDTQMYILGFIKIIIDKFDSYYNIEYKIHQTFIHDNNGKLEYSITKENTENKIIFKNEIVWSKYSKSSFNLESYVSLQKAKYKKSIVNLDEFYLYCINTPSTNTKINIIKNNNKLDIF